MNNYNFHICNLKHFQNIDFSLERITIVGGQGKKTRYLITKLIYCFFLAASKEASRLSNLNTLARFISLCGSWENIVGTPLSSEFSNVSIYEDSFDKIIKQKIEVLKTEAENLDTNVKRKLINKINNMDSYLDLNLSPHNWYFNYLNLLIDTQIGYEFLRDYSKSTVDFHGNIGCYDFNFRYGNSNLSVVMDKDEINHLGFKNVIYLDSNPHLIHENCRFLDYDYSSYLDIILSEKSDVTVDDFRKDFNNLLGGYSLHGTTIYKCLFVRNLSTYPFFDAPINIRLMGLLQLLVENNHLTDSILILDDFDKNLDKKEIDQFGELLVKLSYNLNIHLFINTSDENFINALKKASYEYDLFDETKFYLANTEGLKSMPINNEKFSFDNM